jgi:membrane-bound lytic murein transglycosylase D
MEDPANASPAAGIESMPVAATAESPVSPAIAPNPSIALETDELLVGDVLTRLQARLQPGACALGGEAQDWRKRYAHNPPVFGQHVLSILPLLEFVLAEAERRDLPGEFVLIPIIESWYRPAALGTGGPAGMWQMIASTARNHGVRIRAGYDGRLSPIESTHAALAYLGALQQRFGGWQATVMAYNAGEFRLLGAMQRAGSATVAAERRSPTTTCTSCRPFPACSARRKRRACSCRCNNG